MTMLKLESATTEGPRGWIRAMGRIAEPLADAVRERWSLRPPERESLWSRFSFRLAISRKGAIRAWLLGKTAPPIPETEEEALALYAKTGQRRKPAPAQRAWRDPDAASPAWRVELSQAGQLAGGALASVAAAPGEMDRFVERVRLAKRDGFFQAETFQLARRLLRRAGEVTPAPASE
ncbi:MAG: hypothetical protein HQM03_02015 [Magnetococcales bacterium]|nr:hypothetical protein [Magnetococcales bacterium]